MKEVESRACRGLDGFDELLELLSPLGPVGVEVSPAGLGFRRGFQRKLRLTCNLFRFFLMSWGVPTSYSAREVMLIRSFEGASKEIGIADKKLVTVALELKTLSGWHSRMESLS